MTCKPKPEASIYAFILEMKGYFDRLESLNMVFDAELSINIILSSLTADYNQFVLSYQMNGKETSIIELHSLFQTAEQGIKKIDVSSTSAAPVLIVGHNSKKRKTSHSNWKGKAAKGKSDRGSKRKTGSEIAHTNDLKEAVCFYCNTKGHWKRSCPKYLKDLKDEKVEKGSHSGMFMIKLHNTTTSDSWVLDTGCGTHICIVLQGLKESRRLKHGELNSVMGNKKKQSLCQGLEKEKISDSILNELDEPANYKEAMASLEAAKWKEVMKREIQSMYDNQVWNLVDTTPGLKTVGCKWIFKKKTDMDGKLHTYKARLVAKGYTITHGIDFEETFSLVAKIKSIRIMIAIAAFHDYEIWQMDVKTTFFNGKLIEDVFMAQPKGFENAKYPKRVCKLQKAIYRLKQASRSWNLCFHEKLTQFGFSRSEDETGQNESSLICFGCRIDHVCHEDIRPDVSFSLSMVSRHQQNPGEGHWTAVKNILKYLRNTKDRFLVYGREEELRVIDYCDASWQIDKDDSRSQSGWVFLLNGGAVTWKSLKQDTMVDSTCESEYIAACDASKEAIWMKNFIGYLGVVTIVQDPIEILCDNESVVALTKEPKDYGNPKHIERKYHFVRSKVEEGHVIVKHI
ncbi:retrovirus-related pol polyprotein from transposon TNT 1-94 [Tanacetum coccineum]|uniref:Retrovirus-related pol polyprotein from transposon TNT 1-94 n=1 Tax=Tanacetum coccineum TaxID=301880 RepID=A0ABQ5HJU6_9ASTR